MRSKFQGRSWPLPRLFLLWGMLASVSCTGCGQSDQKPPVAALPATKAADASVDAVLDRLIAAYKGAKSYRDAGKIVLQVTATEGSEKVEFDNRLEFQRPNLMRLEFQPADPRSEPRQVLVVADGKQVFSKPQGFDDQVLVAADPAAIEVPQVYERQNIVLPDGITGKSFVLDLLTAANPLAELDRSKAKMLEPGRIEGQPYERVQFQTEQGPVTLWINQDTSIVRRVEHPANDLLEDLKEQGVHKVALTSEFVDATLNSKIDPERFRWQPTEGEHLVRKLVEPPDPAEAPARILGKPVPEFQFVTSSGESRDSSSLAGKITVIDFWATWCGFCLKGMPGVDQVRQKYADNDKVQFVAMSVDAAKVTNAEIIDVLKQIEVKMPWARMTLKEPDEFYSKFEISGIPAMAILSADGRIQSFHIGMDPKITENLPPKIEALLKGEDLAKQAGEAWDVKLRQYKREVAAASIDGQATIEIPRAGIAKATPPRRFQLVPLWTASDVREPGNVWAGPSDSTSQILVIDKKQDVVELDGAGKVVARHTDLVPKPQFTFLRSALNKENKRFYVAGGVGEEQLHVFDEKWQRTLTYPPEGSAKVFDVQVGDIDGDKQPDLAIGYYGQAGVQAVTLDGTRLMSNRTIENVADIAITEADASGKRRLLCTHQRASLVPIRADGAEEPPLRLPGQAITHVAAGDLTGDGHEQYCTLTMDESGNRQIVGLRLTGGGGDFTWKNPIPAGEHERLIDSLTFGRFEADKPAVWIAAGADGSVSLFAADGTPVDQFSTGEALAGLATATIEGKPALLLAHPDKLLAFRIEKK